MSSTSSWAIKPRPISRRFTTLEGWRELGNGVYVARNSLRIFAVENQFDPESYNGDHTSWTHSQRSENGSLKASSWSSEQDWMASLPGEKKGTVAIGEIVEDEVYHVFGNNERWGVVAMIGVAGLFSGLSSNIFFPSLDAISQVRSHIPFSASNDFNSFAYLLDQLFDLRRLSLLVTENTFLTWIRT